MKNKIVAVILITAGILFASYDVLLLCMSPGTFLDNVFSFTHIWAAFGAYLIFCGVYRIKKERSFWSTWKKNVKVCVVSLAAAGVIISVVNLCFILSPKLVDPNNSVDYVILLGGGIDKNGKLPGNVISRVEAAADFLNRPEQKNAVVVATGGTLLWLPFAEAPELKRQLVLRGVEEEYLDEIKLKISCYTNRQSNTKAKFFASVFKKCVFFATITPPLAAWQISKGASFRQLLGRRL